MITTFFRQVVQMLTWFVVIAPWEQGLRVRLGKHVRVLNAGIYLRVPMIDRVFKQSIRRRLSIIVPQTLTTRDRQVVTVGGAIGFSINDLRKLYDTLESPNDTIGNEVSGLVAKFIGTHPLAQCSAEVIERFVMQHMNLNGYGLSGQQFIITQFAATRTYRLITGEIPSWHRDGMLDMRVETSAPGST